MNKFYNNPVQRGFFPDPSVIRYGSDYYMVNSSFQYFPAIPISHSKDLVHWELVGHAISDPSYLDLSEILDSRGIWAPDISYHNGKFYIFATLRHNSEDKTVSPMRSQLIMTADSPEGPYSRPVIIPLDDIDPSHFTDDDGKHYIVTAPGITITLLNDDCTQIAGKTVQVWAGTGERCPEGPHILKKDGWYYAILAEGGTGYGHRINTARSRDLYGPYEPSPYNPVMKQNDPDEQIQRCGHGKIFQTQNGDWYCTYLCGRRNGGNYTTVGRETALDPVEWTKDGWFIINGGKPSKEQFFPDLEEKIYEKQYFDDFDSDKLSLFWEWVRNPDEKNYSLTERKGYMRLYTSPYPMNDVHCKNILVRREEELTYDAKTKIAFEPKESGISAGITCYYSTATYARCGISYQDGKCIELVINRNKGEEVIARADDIKSGELYLCVKVRNLTRTFYYSYDNKEWFLIGTLENCIYLCDEGVPEDRKRHTGTLTGIYAISDAPEKHISADFDFFDYSNVSL